MRSSFSLFRPLCCFHRTPFPYIFLLPLHLLHHLLLLNATTFKMQRLKMGFPHYIQALEEERRKIQVFPKELPLSLELVTQAIEACKQQLSGTTTEYNLNGQSECSEQTTSTEGPVLEEFIPIKKRASSPYCDEDDEDEQHSHKQNVSKDNKNNDKTKSDWLRSVQLWNPDPPAEEKVPVMDLKRSGNSGGAFLPFHKEERAIKTSESLSEAPSSARVPAASSKTITVTGENAGSSKREEREGRRKQRRCWSQDLHKRFLHALQQLGGADSATPKQIRELMNVEGLTNDEVKSHLQKYRLHTRRPSTIVHDSANPHTAPFVLVGNIFVQSSEYAAVATSTASREVTTVAAPAGIYAPVATHPPAVKHPPTDSIKKPHFKKVELFEHSNSEERGNHSEGAVHSNSPASSSSTHTPTTSPGY
ncbi:transcription factor HHO3-like isoform X2 [Abrus precatorius]|uniref:Transcription factor HHO3-like isoform X2 n=1 Tax=Abrus precatorius TaxID=3816 RepID=A0A8B8MFK5_ABRPR|nr:transcription factor HHO3-like isoform X2 [Abrus precatorius]